jgi:citrate lyase subunit beta/citryl-CoA lyase
VEGYRGLVVHGPLQATLLFNLAADHRNAAPMTFAYRGLAPAIVGDELLACGRRRRRGGHILDRDPFRANLHGSQGGSVTTLPPLTAPLFVPANRPDRFPKAASSGADAVIVDLEDAVPPALKGEARSNLAAALTLSVPVMVRVNAEGTDWHAADLDAVVHLGFRLVCAPKVEGPNLLDRLASKLGSGVEIVAQIETAGGAENAAAIAGHRCVRQLAFGPADFFLHMGMPASSEMTGHVLRRLALASRAAAIEKPLDGPCFAVADEAALLRECAEAIASGAGGKLCIHPSQPGKVLEQFLPGPKRSPGPGASSPQIGKEAPRSSTGA